MSNFGFSVIKDPGGDKLMRKSPVTDFENYSKLIVERGQAALIVVDGDRETILGPGRFNLNTGQWVVFKGIQNSISKGMPSHSSEVYFFDVNPAIYRNLYADVNDCIAIDLETGTQIRANPRICFSVRISDPHLFEQFYKGSRFSDEEISKYITSALTPALRQTFYKEMSSKPILKVNADTATFANFVTQKAAVYLRNQGIDVKSCSVENLNINRDDLNSLSEYYKSIRDAKVMAKQVKIIADGMFGGDVQKASQYYLQTQAVKNPGCNPVSWSLMRKLIDN